MTARSCPAMLIAAPASGQGKTTVTAALARLHSRQGRKVRVFKCGPDFLDPMILQAASGAPVYQLDLWMVGLEQSRRLLWEAAAEADLILVEGVMGLFDGTPSAADLAREFGVPVLGVIDGSGMAQTFAAMAWGLANFQPDLGFAGVLGNKLGSVRHGEILRDSLPDSLHWYGGLPRSTDMELPSRHLGLVQAAELPDLLARLDAAADALEQSSGAPLPEPVSFPVPSAEALQPLLAGVRIGVARDQAFAFVYQANLALLQEMGAELIFFSPLTDETLPEVDSVYLPGGYPELHAGRLATGRAWVRGLVAARDRGAVIFGECGGYMALGQGLTDADGRDWPMAGLLGLSTSFAARRLHLGYRLGRMVAGPLEGRLWRGHEFHYATITAERGDPLWSSVEDATGAAVEGAQGLRAGRVAGSFLHLIAAGQSVAG
ncbi:MAG TPA: cobyrinate a,c-diamide synthase [Tistrella mobilis]|uniref:Cobyrinate a,c-diamide synthase n=1 Tax=Tistrella mobilis TaxID=171437 RepID=A0A3B9IHG3_9PROT|nr:cobyrinate a,c-diamide synthase [Tistrella mobilis]